MISVEEDMRTRMVPSAEQLATARMAFRVRPDVTCVLVPLAFPGKTAGLWQVGRPVEHPEGALLVIGTSEAADRWARNGAVDAADLCLGDREGAVAYVRIYPDETWKVFRALRPARS